MPTTSTTYASLYGGDVHVLPPSHHDALVSRPLPDYRHDPAPGAPLTYSVRKDSLGRGTTVAEDPSRHPRSSATDTTSKRPIIVTTKHASGAPRSGSPSRDPYRSSEEGQYYAQPASSIGRARSTTRAPYSAAMGDDEYRRLKERTEHDRLLAPRTSADSYRSTRPTVLYANTPHRTTTMEFNDEGYEYTKPSDLARYDLDHDKPRRGRRESVDRYYRPSVSVTTDLTARPYEQNERRQRGPPPTTWGLDKINRAPVATGGIYDSAGVRMPVPPAAPLPPDHPRRSGIPDTPASPERRSASRTRPISLIQDGQMRSSHHEEYYRAREEELLQREIRDRDRDFFQDNSITSRGFGIRVDPGEPDEHHRPVEPHHRDDRRERREAPPRREFDERDLPRKRSLDDLDLIRRREHEDRERERDRDYDRDRRGHRDYDHDRDYHDHAPRVDDDYVRDRRDRKGKEVEPPEDERESKKDKIREKVVAGIGLAAASMGLLPPKEKDEKEDRDGASSSRRRKDEDPDRRRSDEDVRSKPSRKETLLGDEDFEIIDHPEGRERPHKDDGFDTRADTRDRDYRRDRERDDLNGDTAAGGRRDHSSSTDEGKPTTRRRQRPSSAFNPNDAAGLAELKAQIAAQEDREKDKVVEQQIPTINEPSSGRRSPTLDAREPDADEFALSLVDDSRGRELALPSREEKQVRVVSPPRDKDEKKPIKGILKQPKPQFPEEPNPVREGVAPHKDDKTKADVPQGARWTKISRKMVNPEALTIGKERFELRDDFVIVLRVLSKEEIQGYAAATAQLRERRKKEYEREKEQREVEYEQPERDEEDDRRRKHRQHRIEAPEDRREGARESTRHRRHRHESDEEDEYRHHHGHHRSHRDRGRERDSVYAPVE